jgi:hypothetical protein
MTETRINYFNNIPTPKKRPFTSGKSENEISSPALTKLATDLQN